MNPLLKNNSNDSKNDEQKIILITVGLPASGKTFLC
jgi:hypothetical protein